MTNPGPLKIGLILIGYDADLVYELEWSIPVDFIRSVRGGHLVSGEAMEVLDIDSLAGAAIELDPFITHFIISSYAGVSNPEHEEEARQLLSDLTGKPVCCGTDPNSRYNAVLRA